MGENGMDIYSIASGACSGIYNMALDEALLEHVRHQAEPLLIVRTYQWEVPTLSLGVNQKVRDIRFLLEFYGKGSGCQQPVQAVVRRPTGGRAILHGQDISYSFITNEPAVLRQSLKDSYAVYAGIIRDTLALLALSVNFTDAAGDRDYLRSPVCFETHTASDLVGEDGKKLTGSAQLRRSGGLLQHGAAFLQPYAISESQFHQALIEITATTFHQAVTPIPAEWLAAAEPKRLELEVAYRNESREILDNASTISGSHLEPASF